MLERLGARVISSAEPTDDINAGSAPRTSARFRMPRARPEPTWPWPSTATVTACSRWTRRGRRSTATILAIRALDLRREGLLAGDVVITTTTTNPRLRRAMAAEGIEVRWTDVVDRYVLEEMRQAASCWAGADGHVST